MRSARDAICAALLVACSGTSSSPPPEPGRRALSRATSDLRARQVTAGAAHHHAFPDLAAWRGHLWLAYREASSHVAACEGDTAIIRLLRSSDGGATWSPADTIAGAAPGDRVGTASLSVNAADELVVTSAEVNFGEVSGCEPADAGRVRRWSRNYVYDRVAASGDLVRARPFHHAASAAPYWTYSARVVDAVYYSLGYKGEEGQPLQGVARRSSPDGKGSWTEYELLRPFAGSLLTEADFVIRPDGSVVLLARVHERDGTTTGAIGVAPSFGAPANQWTFSRLAISIEGPELELVPDGRILAAYRTRVAGNRSVARVALARLDDTDATLHELMEIEPAFDPSVCVPTRCWDIGYPDLLRDGETLYIAQYRALPGNETRAHVYLVRAPLSALQR